MALHFHCLPITCSSTRFSPRFEPNKANINRFNNVVYSSGTRRVEPVVDEKVVRRSANWKPNFWDLDNLMSLTISEYKENIYKEKAAELQEIVRQAFNDSLGSLSNLDYIDVIQRLGLGHYYKEEIKRALDNEFINYNQSLDDDLYTTSLRFRLLRQHGGYDVSQDAFKKFKDESGALKMCLFYDVKAMLSLYEASYLGLEGEDLMDEVKALTIKQLEALLGNTELISPTLAKKVAHSLEVPLHWRTPKLEARWYIDVYEGEDNMVPMLLVLAKLNYNIDQATYQSEIRNLTRWWIDLGLHKLDFSRDRIMEHLCWSLEMVPIRQYGHFREGLTPFNSLITAADDVYDIYGTLEELELFTNVVERWDASAMQTLPQPMKICFMAILNVTNEIGYKILKEDGYDVIPHQKKAWVNQCKAYLKEAKWFYQGYTPTLNEYLENAAVTIGAPLMLLNTTTPEMAINDWKSPSFLTICDGLFPSQLPF